MIPIKPLPVGVVVKLGPYKPHYLPVKQTLAKWLEILVAYKERISRMQWENPTHHEKLGILWDMNHMNGYDRQLQL